MVRIVSVSFIWEFFASFLYLCCTSFIYSCKCTLCPVIILLVMHVMISFVLCRPRGSGEAHLESSSSSGKFFKVCHWRLYVGRSFLLDFHYADGINFLICFCMCIAYHNCCAILVDVLLPCSWPRQNTYTLDLHLHSIVLQDVWLHQAWHAAEPVPDTLPRGGNLPIRLPAATWSKAVWRGRCKYWILMSCCELLLLPVSLQASHVASVQHTHHVSVSMLCLCWHGLSVMRVCYCMLTLKFSSVCRLTWLHERSYDWRTNKEQLESCETRRERRMNLGKLMLA